MVDGLKLIKMYQWDQSGVDAMRCDCPFPVSTLFPSQCLVTRSPSRPRSLVMVSPLSSPLPFVFVVTKQVNERGGFKEDREDQWKHNGGLHEEAAPKQHRKPERTPRYTRRSSSHPKPGLKKCSRMFYFLFFLAPISCFKNPE